MKYRITYTLVCYCFALNVNGQEDNLLAVEVPERFKTKYEVSLGGTVSLMQSDDQNLEKSMGRKYGFIIQLGLSQYLAPRFDLNFSVSYGNKGYVSQSVTEDLDFTPPKQIENNNVLTLTYVNTYFLPKFYIDERALFALSLGPYLGLRVSEKLYARQYVDDVLTYEYTYRNTLGFKKLDFGLSSEFSYQPKVLGRQVAFKVRWDRGLFNIGPGSAAIYNQIFALQLGVVF